MDEVHAAGRFQELLFIVDTCQGGTLFEPFRTPGVLAVGSSGRGQNSYAHQNDLTLGVALVDRFTDASCQYMHRLADGGEKGAYELGPVLRHLDNFPLEALLRSFNPTQLKSTPVLRTDLFHHIAEPGGEHGHGPGPTAKPPKVAHTHVDHFFSHARPVRLLESLPLDHQDDEDVGEEAGALGPGHGQAVVPRAQETRRRRPAPAAPTPVLAEQGDSKEAASMHTLATLAVCALSWAVLRREGFQ